MAKRKEGEIVPAYILWTWSANSKGKHPVKIRVTHQRKRDYYPIFLSDRQKLFLTSEQYQLITSTPISKLRGENRSIRSLMEEAVQNARLSVEDSTNRGKTPFSFSKFESKFLGAEGGKGFLLFFKAHLDKLAKKGQAGTMRTYSSAYSALKDFFKGRDIDPADLTVEKLNEFDEWLRDSHSVVREGKTVKIAEKNDTSISIYMRCLRSVYNEIAANDDYLTSIYPFSRTDRDKKYKIPQSSGQKGQTLTPIELKKFINGKVKGDAIPENPMYRSKQLFLFSFFGQGINFKDMALLKYENINKNSLEFERQKTIRTRTDARKIIIPLTKELEALLIELGNPEKKKANFVFEVFDTSHLLTPKQKDDKVRQWIKTTNKWLKRYCEFNKIDVVSTYASRHTFASIAKSHLPLAMISQMLGHSRVTTTQNYLGRFGSEENREGLEKVFEQVS